MIQVMRQVLVRIFFRVCAMRTEAFNIFFCDIFAVRLKIDGADLK